MHKIKEYFIGALTNMDARRGQPGGVPCLANDGERSVKLNAAKAEFPYDGEEYPELQQNSKTAEDDMFYVDDEQEMIAAEKARKSSQDNIQDPYSGPIRAKGHPSLGYTRFKVTESNIKKFIVSLLNEDYGSAPFQPPIGNKDLIGQASDIQLRKTHSLGRGKQDPGNLRAWSGGLELWNDRQHEDAEENFSVFDMKSEDEVSTQKADIPLIGKKPQKNKNKNVFLQ